MRQMWVALFVIGLSAAQAYAAEDFLGDTEMVDDSSARFLYLNTSSTATSLTLLGAVILLGVIAYLVYAGGLLNSGSAYNRNDYYQGNDPYGQQGYYDQAQYRSNNDVSDFNLLNAIYMMQELYEKFDYNDLECQKKLICEVMREPEYFGNFARKAKTGFQWGATLADMVTLPDDVRELVDEYMDATSRADSQKECTEYFQCPFSIKEAIQKNFGNHL